MELGSSSELSRSEARRACAEWSDASQLQRTHLITFLTVTAAYLVFNPEVAANLIELVTVSIKLRIAKLEFETAKLTARAE
jgi:cell division protein FtsB